MLQLSFVRHVVVSVDRGVCVGLSLPAQESYNEAHQQNAQPLHYLPAGTNILALWVVFFNFSGYTTHRRQARGLLTLQMNKRLYSLAKTYT